MKHTFIKLIHQLAAKPKTLFLLDGIGAGITALFLLFILLNLSAAFGMPKTALIVLLCVALSFCLYSISCFIFLKEKWILFIRIISIANVLYCLITLSLICIHFKQLTTLGTTYFLGEIAIIFVLVYIEMKVAGRILQIRKTTHVDGK